jgi:hypothetical protein
VKTRTAFTYRPLSTWPGPRTAPRDRRSSPFSAKWAITVELVDRECAHLAAAAAVIEIALDERHFRLDGLPRATAPQPVDPGVVLSLPRSMHGPLRYSCDGFTRWQDNVRAIALGLESLRRVERYGIAKRGEQYAGWKQLPETTMSAHERLRRVLLDAGLHAPHGDGTIPRRALKVAHPDAGGDPDVFRDEILPAYQLLTGEPA